MKIKVPRKIQIGGHLYSIVFNDGLLDDTLTGAHNPRQNRIEISPHRPSVKWTETLLHEIVHSVNNVYANNRLGEDDVNAVSQGLFQVFAELGLALDWSDIPTIKVSVGEKDQAFHKKLA